MFLHDNLTLLRLASALLLTAFVNLPAVSHPPESTQPVIANTTPVMATGTVSELTVQNQVTGVTLHYFGLKLDQGMSYALAGTGLEMLAEGARITVTGTLGDNVLTVAFFSVVDQAQTSARRTTLGQKQKTITGTLAVYHKDFFNEGRGEYGLAVRDALGTPTQLNVAAIPDSLQIGMLITVDGTTATDGTSLDTSSITILAPAPAALNDVAPAPKTNTVLVIPIRFSDSPADSFNGAAIDTEFQTRVAPYYQEVSYGQQLLNITVACTTTVLAGCAGRTDANGWFQSTSPTPAGCDYTTMSNLATAAASAAGYDTSITSAKFVYVVLPGGSGCGWAGLAYVGYGLAYSANYNALWVYGHELGHNFGLWHAGSVGCGAQVLGGSCGASEYGDPFDVMGNIRQMHFNTKQKAVLNWIPSTSVKVHTSGTQTYQLSPLETGSQSTYAVKIPTTSTSRTYWVEYRQPIGFDSPLSSLPNLGAQIRVSSPFEFSSGSDDTEILDMTPTSGGGFDDAALLAGQTYVDSVYGVTINVISATPGPSGLLTFSVAMGGKTNASTTLTSSGSPSLVGANVSFTATVNGSAPTGNVAFTADGTTISGCGALALPAGSASSKTATCSISSLSAGTHSIVATYAGDASNNGSTSATWSQVVKTASSTTLSSSGSPSFAGTGVTFTATVAGSAPTGSVAFTDGGSAISGCSAVAMPVGSANSKVATCTTSSLTVGTHSIVAAYAGDAGNNASSSTVLSQVVNSSSSGSNVALASAGAVASASSTYSPSASFSASSINNNERAGTNWGNGGGWIDGTPNAFPDWVQIVFNGQKTINRVVVYSVQDNFTNPIEPTDTQTFSIFGVTDFTVAGWNGSAWVTLATVSGNTLVKRTVNFSAFTTDRIRINITNGLNSYSRLTEVEAWGVDAGPPGTNVALASTGAVASASSTYSPSASFPASSINNNERAGTNWGNGGGWIDGTANAFPDWVQIVFNGQKTINRVVVYSVQDNFTNPVEPSDTQTFSTFGVTDFTVDGWNGSAWVTLATVSGNNLVKCSVAFLGFTTDRIRINITNGLYSYSRLTEVEAWGN